MAKAPTKAPAAPRAPAAPAAPAPAVEAAPAPAPAPTPAPKAAAPAKKRMRYKSKTYPLYHPYQKVRVPVHDSVPLDVDSWVEVQVAAGVLIEAGED